MLRELLAKIQELVDLNEALLENEVLVIQTGNGWDYSIDDVTWVPSGDELTIMVALEEG